MLRLFAAAAALVAIATPAAVFAHSRLVSATPAADAADAAPTRVALKFSERLIPGLSGATLLMTGMGGAAHAPMAVPGTASSVGADGNSLVVTAKKPLPAGTYRVDWHVVSGDTHRVNGSYAFTVR